MSIKNKLVFIGMSGGVDSSVAAYLLKKQGYEVVGVFMRGYNIDNCQEKDSEDARRVAEHLNIPFYVWDFEKDYKAKVVDYMIDGYKKGLTPNPDVMCNKEIKFGLFFERAMKFGADYVATGHYVKKITSDHPLITDDSKTEKSIRKVVSDKSAAISYSLAIAKDTNKDQSYFLWALNQNQIVKSLFPLGDYLKPDIRKIAKKIGISTAEKKDSQGVCFLGMVNIKEFLKKYIPEKVGDVLNLSGEKIGEHNGVWFYTIGQRSGVGNLKHQKGQKNHQPLYVVSKDIKNNILVVAEGGDNKELYKKEVFLDEVNFDGQIFKNLRMNVLARVRYRQSLFGAVLVRGKKGWKLEFLKPQKFVAEGQSAVIYDKDGTMLGGGVIK
jgi:tRNA-specific 2-thiouridylase